MTPNARFGTPTALSTPNKNPMKVCSLDFRENLLRELGLPLQRGWPFWRLVGVSSSPPLTPLLTLAAFPPLAALAFVFLAPLALGVFPLLEKTDRRETINRWGFYDVLSVIDGKSGIGETRHGGRYDFRNFWQVVDKKWRTKTREDQ